MTPSDRSVFTTLLTDVLGFYGQATSPFALSVWWEACKDMELGSVRAAMTAYATDPDRGHFAPKPADVIRIVRGSVNDRAMSAWSDAVEQARTVGSYGRPQFDDRQRDALAAIGGYAVLCRADEGELHFLQRRFVERYVSTSAEDQRKSLTGSPRLARIE